MSGTNISYAFKVVNRLPRTGVLCSAFAQKSCVQYTPDIWAHPQQHAPPLSVFDNYAHAETFRSLHTHDSNDLRLEIWLCAHEVRGSQSEASPPGTIRTNGIKIVERWDDLPHHVEGRLTVPATDEAERTPDELHDDRAQHVVDVQRQVKDGTYPHEATWRAMDAGIRAAFAALCLPPEPKPQTDPTKAEWAELLAEHVVRTLHDAMLYFCIDDGKIEAVIERFTETLDLDQWFAGAGE